MRLSRKAGGFPLQFDPGLVVRTVFVFGGTIMARVRVRLPKRQRVRLNKKTVDVWSPEWSLELRGWSFRYIKKTLWQYEFINEPEDLMQDAYLVFDRVRSSYPWVTSPAQFMALYKTSLRNYLFDKKREFGRKVNLIDESLGADDITTIDPASTLDMVDTLYFLESDISCPEELKLFFKFIRDDRNLETWRAPQRAKRGEARLTFDQRLSKLLGVKEFPFKQALRDLLSCAAEPSDQLK